MAEAFFMPMHKSVKPSIKVIHAEVILSPSKKQKMPGFLKDRFLLLNPSHLASTVFSCFLLHWADLSCGAAGQACGPASSEPAFWLCGSTTTGWRALKRWERSSLCFSQRSPDTDLCLGSKSASACFPQAVPESQSHTVVPIPEKQEARANPGKGFWFYLSRCQGHKKRNSDIYRWAIVN